MTDIQSCSVGNFLLDECHKTIYVKKRSLLRIQDELTGEEKNLLLWRCGMQAIDVNESSLSSDACVCSHHCKVYLDKYCFKQRSCCDPFNKHKSLSKRSLRKIDISIARKILLMNGKSAKPGQKLCSRCFDAVSKYFNRDSQTFEGDYQPDCEPSNEHEAPQPCVGCKDLEKIVNDLKKLCSISSPQKQITILTLVPSSWSVKKTANEFNVTEYQVKKARKVVQLYGILGSPEYKKGKQLSESTTKLVEEFYDDDEYSRICPGKKDYISIRQPLTGERVQVQKRLLLCNILELHAMFKEKYPNVKVEKSKFFELRPRWCITAGAKGMHNVCVCAVHQNMKLMLLQLHMNYKEAMNLIVCDIESKDCMIHRCETCPGKEAAAEIFLKRLKEEFLLSEDDSITFKQWEHTDRSTITTQILRVEDYVEKLCNQLHLLTSHHITAIEQASYLRNCKETLDSTTVLILLDFSQNYSFVVQDSIQGYYWNNSQATLHPFAIYYKSSPTDEKTSVINGCVISDCLTHDAVTVHCFQQVVIEYLKTIRPEVRHVLYFSDGTSSQYKNCKNFKNLCMHEMDFGLTAEWHFFATSHGKSVCDAIGGTIKRLATRCSLQHPTSGQILTPLDLYQWANKNVKGINCFYVSQNEVELCREQLQERLQQAVTIPGTRSHHFFFPTTEHQLQMSRFSSPELRAMTVAHVSNAPCVSLTNVNPGQYVAAVYEHKWYIGRVTRKCEKYQDFLVNFMVPPGPSASFRWPKHVDECWIPSNHIILRISVVPTSSSSRQYKLSDDVQGTITKSFKDMFSVLFK